MRRWFSASIVNRITLAAAGLTSLVVLLLAVISHGSVSALIRDSVDNTLRGYAALAAEVMESELNGFSKELGGLAANTLVVTGLLDATGRDLHLRPFLRDHKPSIRARAGLALCDFRGRPIAASRGIAENSCGNHLAVRAALDTGKAHAQILRGAEHSVVLLAQPIFYPATRNVEGVLVGAADSRYAFTAATAFLNLEYRKRLLAGGLMLAGDPYWDAGGELAQASSLLKLAAPLDALKLRVDIGMSRGEAFATLRWVTAAYVGIGAIVLIFTFWIARAMARRLTAPIVALSDTAARIAAGGSAWEPAPVSGNDEPGRLAALFNEMLRRLRDSHELLERRVEERTAELERAQHQLSSILGAMKEVVWSVSPITFETLYVSPGVELVYGRGVDEFMRNPGLRLESVDPADRERIAGDFHAELLRSGSVKAEYRIVRPNGETRWVEDRGRVIRDAQGNIVRLDGIVMDITERKLAEEALLQNQARLTEAQRIGQIGDWDWNIISGRITWSEECYHLFGVSPQSFEPSYEGFLNCVHADDRRRVEAIVQHAYNTRESAEYDCRIVWPDGSVHALTSRLQVVADADGKPVRMHGTSQDITQQELSEEALRQSEQRLRLHFERAPLGVIEWDPQFRVTKWNAAAERIFGYSREEALGRHASFIMPASAQEEVDQVWRALMARAGGDRSTNENVRKDGCILLCEWYNTPLVGPDGEIIGAASLVADITERRQREQALRLRDRAIESSVNAILITANGAPDHPIEYVNPAFERITGYSLQEAVGRNCRFLQGADRDQPELERIRAAIREQREGHAVLRNYRKDGSLFWNELRVAPVRNEAGSVTHFVGILNDVTEAKRYQAELEHQATHDALTGLANRNLLNDRLQQEMRNAQRYGRQLAVAFIDLDGFKLVNDSLGHGGGDLLLKSVAERLKSLMRESDTVARLAGDEFVLLCSDQKNEATPMQLAQRVLENLAQPYVLDGREACLTCSIGMSIYPQDGHDAETLLRNADAALYRAKETGRNNVYFYSEGVNARLRERLSLHGSLRRAIEQRQFVLHYQPKLELSSGRVSGLEALLRWENPDRGLVSPAEFIPALEETGMIVEVGRQVLEMAAADHAHLLARGFKPLRIAVNVSQRQLQRKDFVSSLKNAASSGPDVAAWLDLEITESLLMENVEETAVKLKMIREMGVEIAIDDFGTGYSSLNYLATLPVGALKVDRSFTSRITSDPNGTMLVSTIISLAHSLKMKVVAEGVETQEQARLLKLFRCDEIQGYLVGRPCALADVVPLLAGAAAASIDIDEGASAKPAGSGKHRLPSIS